LATLPIGAGRGPGVAAITFPLAVPTAAWAPLGHGIGLLGLLGLLAGDESIV